MHENGKHVIAINLIDGIGFGTTEFHVLRPKKEILPEWVHFFIRQPYFLREATTYFTGAVGQQRIPEYFLSDYVIPLPPLDKQHRIASKLQELMQEIYNLQSAIRNQQSALDALPSAYLREVFESEEAKKWERKMLGEVCEVCQYGLTATATNDKGFPYIRITDIDDLGNIKLDAIKFISCDGNSFKKYALKEGDIFFARSGSIGRTFLYNGTPENAIFASYLIRFRIKQEIINPSYLFYHAHSPEYYKFIEEKKHTVSQPNINAEEYKSLLIPIPPISVQRHIAFDLKEKMAQVERLQSTISNLQSTIEVLPQAILRKAFRGEL